MQIEGLASWSLISIYRARYTSGLRQRWPRHLAVTARVCNCHCKIEQPFVSCGDSYLAASVTDPYALFSKFLVTPPQHIAEQCSPKMHAQYIQGCPFYFTSSIERTPLSWQAQYIGASLLCSVASFWNVELYAAKKTKSTKLSLTFIQFGNLLSLASF